MRKIAIIPLSVNNAYQGRRFKTPELKAYQQKVMSLLPKDFHIPDKTDIALKLDEDFVYTGEVLPEYTGSNKRLLCEFPYLKFTPFDVALNNMIKYYTKEKCSVDEGLLEY